MTDEFVLHKDSWVSLILFQKIPLTKFITLYKFQLPDGKHNLGCHAGEYVACRAKLNREYVVRYYSPLTPIENVDDLELAIKFDGKGLFSKFMNDLKEGDTLEFSGPIGGFSYEPNKHKKLALIAGGTGISPMLQIISKVLSDPKDKTIVKLLYGAVEESELIFKKELDEMAKDSRLTLYYTLDKAPQNWKHGNGYLTKEVFQKELSGGEWQIVVCGPPKMCEIMDKILFSIDGFNKDNVYNFGRRSSL